MTSTTDTTHEPGPNDVTTERAQMLANHAIYVQGGYSDAATERARAESQLSRSPGSIDWDRMKQEVMDAIAARISTLPAAPVAAPAPEPAAAAAAPEPAAPAAATPDPAVDPTPATGKQRANVTAVLASVDQGEALRDRIKKLTAELKVHEDNIKDALGEATLGVDSSGKIVVRYPFRNRSGLSKEKVKDRLTAEQYAECETVTEYRTLLYGEG